MRLLGRDTRTNQMKEYILAGMTDDTPGAMNKTVRVYPGEGLARTDKAPNELDLVFNVPDSNFEPYMLEFKQNARVLIDESMDKSDPKKRPPSIRANGPPTTPPRKPAPSEGAGEAPAGSDNSASPPPRSTPNRPSHGTISNVGTGSNPN